MTDMTEERVKRKLAAILVADVAGYSRLMGEDEAGTLTALKDHRAALIDPTIAAHNGRTIKVMGDATLAEFASVVDAVQCAVTLQQEMACRNADVPQDRRIEFRIGINLGDVIVDGDDIYGDGVNVAARLESLVRPGGICISGAVYDAIGKKLATRFEFMGEQEVKNIEKPVRAYGILAQPSPAEARTPTPTADTRAPAKRSSRPSLAIKPFESIGADPDQDPLADGLTNGIAVALTRVPGLTLIQDESPLMQRSKQMTVSELADTFDVHYVLKGGVRKRGERVRVNAELMEVATGHVLWADNFDRQLRDPGDLFAIEDAITEEIVTTLDVKLLSGEAARIVRNALKTPAARESLYRAEELLWSPGTKLEIREAQRLFEEVIRLEPDSYVGYADGALAYWVAAISGLSDEPSQSLERAAELAQKAIALDDATGYALLILAYVHLYKRNYDAAIAAADRAVLARPSCPGAYSLKASVLTYLGRPAEAIDVAKFVLRLTPVHPPMHPAVLASAYYGCERHEEAIAAAQMAIDLNGNDVDPYLILAASNVALGRTEEARRAAEIVLKLMPEFRLEVFAASQPYKEQKRLDRLLDQLRSAGLA